MRQLRAPAWFIFAGVIVMGVGVVVWWFAPPVVLSFGWFAYAPMSDTTFRPPGAFGSPQAQTGAAVAILGALLTSGSVGWLLGSRSSRSRS